MWDPTFCSVSLFLKVHWAPVHEDRGRSGNSELFKAWEHSGNSLLGETFSEIVQLHPRVREGVRMRTEAGASPNLHQTAPSYGSYAKVPITNLITMWAAGQSFCRGLRQGLP